MKKNLMKTLALTIVFALCIGSALVEDAVSVIMNSGTTQAFMSDPVKEEDLNTILKAGLSATSAINQQPWFFVAVTDNEVMDELSGSGFAPSGNGMPGGFGGAEGMPEGTGRGAPDGVMPEGGFPGIPAGMPGGGFDGMPAASSGSAKAALGDSPVAIIIYMNGNTSSPNASFDCGLACQNMVIAANALGYGTKIISSPTSSLNGTNHDAICERLGVDPALTAVAVLLIGTPDVGIDGYTGASVRESLEEKANIIK